MRTRIRFMACAAAAGAVFAVAARADGPHIYAIQGARLVTATGAPVARGTIVIRNGLIDAVGAGVQVPADATVVDGTGLTVYPGLIDMGTPSGLDLPVVPPLENARTTEDTERWKRRIIFRPELEAANYVRPDSPDLAGVAATGVTTVLATPSAGLVTGRSALVNVVAPPDEPQIGAVADPRRGVQIVRAPVALHVDLGGTTPGRGYPASLMGSIAFVRQHFLDAQHQRLAQQQYDRVKVGMPRPIHDPGLDALQPPLGRQLPVAFEAALSREIRRALAMAKEFGLDPVITGAREADQVIDELKALDARVVYNLDYPTRSRALAPDADEPIRTLRVRAQAPRTPAALHRAGVLFAFSSSGLREPRDFTRNAARAVKEGLPADAAIRALTIHAAAIAGAADRLGSLEAGKIANVIVTDGDLFEERTRVRHVFVDGRMVDIDQTPQPAGRGRGAGGGH